MHVHSRVPRRVATLVAFVALLAAASLSGPATARADRGAGYSLNTHAVMVDDSGRLVSWIPERDRAYSSVAAIAWDYLLTKVPNDPINGQPAYLSHSYLNTDTQAVTAWPHNPAGLYAMVIESAEGYYRFSGDARVITLARRVADAQLGSGMTAATDSWARVPYASGDSGSLVYKGAAWGNESGSGDGVGVIQPDKIGELGHGLVTLYKITGERKYLDAAVQGANVLVAKRRPGNETQSPWPYRVTARDNVVKEEYGANVTGFLDLFDDLIELNVGDVPGYRSARTAVWDWTMAYPMKNGNWSGYFEDVAIQRSPSSNLNQLNAMQFARYLLLKRAADPSWEAHVRALIAWTEKNFADTTDGGATTIREQKAFDYRMGSHTARYASVNALLWAATGDAGALEKAYRSFNWATYMTRTNGVVIDGPEVNNQWFTDGYGDYIRHFMVGLGALPQFAPAGQTHLLTSTGTVRSVTYGATTSYTTFESRGTETIKTATRPSSVTVDGTALAGSAWTYDTARQLLTVVRAAGTRVEIGYSAQPPANSAPSVRLSSPANGAEVASRTPVELTAVASDSDGSVAAVEFFVDGTSAGVDKVAPYATTVENLSEGPHLLTARATDDDGTAATSAAVRIVVTAPAGDVTAPVITGVVAGAINLNGGTVSWVTDEPSSSQIEYGPTSTYGSRTAVNPSLTTQHAQVVSGLDPGTGYHFRVRSTDAAGNVAVSPDGTFTTQSSTPEPTATPEPTVTPDPTVSPDPDPTEAPEPDPTPTASVDPPQPDDEWISRDVGPVGLAGRDTTDGSSVSITASGVDIWDREDSFRFRYQPVSGDTTITALVTAQADTDPWALAGIMVRSSLEPDSPTAILARTPGHGLSWTTRTEAGADAQYAGTPVTEMPVWLRVIRSSDDLAASYSTDGVRWYPAGRVTWTLPDTAYVGLAVTSHDNTRLGAAEFDSVSVTDVAATATRNRQAATRTTGASPQR